MPEISIIIPVYNLEKYIRACLDSVIGQTYKDIEIIIVDDGSKDKSGKICDEYAEKDKRIKVIHKQNGGLSAARNTGLSEAKGKYIMLVDGDDFIDLEMCGMLHSAIVTDNADIAICGINNITETGEVILSLNDDSPLKSGVISADEYREEMLKKGNWYYVVAWNKLYKKEAFENVQYPVGKIHEDEFVIHRIIDNCDKISCITDRLYNYVNHIGSITNSGYSIKRLDILTSLFDRSLFYMKTNVADSIISKNTVACVKTLYDCYGKSDMKNSEFRDRYKEIHKQLRSLIVKTMKYKMKFSHRIFLGAFRSR